MADNTKIEWTDATWNPITGCTRVSAGCQNCYAEKLAGTRLKHHPSRKGLTKMVNGRPIWTGEVRFNEQWLDQPLRWQKPRMIFVCAHGDLFHEDVPFEWMDKVFAVMALSQQHIFQILTKRPERMRDYMNQLVAGKRSLGDCLRMMDIDGIFSRLMIASAYGVIAGNEESGTPPYQPFPNVWLGVSIEDQKTADERIPHLLQTPAAIRWVSYEPALGPVNFRVIMRRGAGRMDGHPADLVVNALDGFHATSAYSLSENGPKVDWIVAGGESGNNVRPAHPDWFRSVRDQCAAAGVPFLFKQWGAWLPCGMVEDETAHKTQILEGTIMCRVGKKRAGRLLDGVEHNGFPALRAADEKKRI